MRALLLLLIRTYWFAIPQSKRRRCIFKVSCSNHVYEVAKTKGLYCGLVALTYRFRNCNGDYHLFDDPVHGDRRLVLKSGDVINADHIADRLL